MLPELRKTIVRMRGATNDDDEERSGGWLQFFSKNWNAA